MPEVLEQTAVAVHSAQVPRIYQSNGNPRRPPSGAAPKAGDNNLSPAKKPNIDPKSYEEALRRLDAAFARLELLEKAADAQKREFERVDYFAMEGNVVWLTPSSVNQVIQEHPATTQALSLEQAAAQFKQALEAHSANKGTAEYQKTVLDVMGYTSERAVEIITPESIDLVKNNGITPVRAAIFSVFERTRRLLGRDSEAVILEDTSEYFRRLSNILSFSTAQTGRGGASTNPFTWVNEFITPILDTDMKDYVAPIAMETIRGEKRWRVNNPKPYFHLQRKIYDRIFGRNSRN